MHLASAMVLGNEDSMSKQPHAHSNYLGESNSNLVINEDEEENRINMGD